jgi:hypothetical protein
VLALPEIKKLQQVLTARVVKGDITAREAVRELIGRLPIVG